MARIVSFVVLVAILLVIAVLFFQVMKQFLLPMFMAVLLAVMFGPLHHWLIAKCRGRNRLAAGLTTALIILILFVPLVAILIPACVEGQAIYATISQTVAQQTQEPTDAAADQQTPRKQPPLPADAGEIRPHPARPVPGKEAPNGSEKPAFNKWAAGELAKLAARAGLKLRPNDVETTITTKLQQWLTPVVLGTTQYVVGLVIGLVVMIIALYYFLADGPSMIYAVTRLLPLDHRYEQQLIEQFVTMTRAVVVATLLAAFVQGLLAGLGYYLAGLESVFLLMLLTMLLAMVPFVGTPIIWVPACLWLLLYQERTLAAILLAIYCGVVVSNADNLVKPLVLHGRANLHPLLALLSVLGGVQALGPIGIFVGPMAVSFLQSLLNMLHKELDVLSRESQPQGA